MLKVSSFYISPNQTKKRIFSQHHLAPLPLLSRTIEKERAHSLLRWTIQPGSIERNAAAAAGAAPNGCRRCTCCHGRRGIQFAADGILHFLFPRIWVRSAVRLENRLRRRSIWHETRGTVCVGHRLTRVCYMTALVWNVSTVIFPLANNSDKCITNQWIQNA